MKKKNSSVSGGNLVEFIISLENQLLLTLPGAESQLKLAPVCRLDELRQEPPEDAIQSSVLLLIFPVDRTLRIAVILRSVYDGAHSGQISFPGGRKELSDNSHAETALREAMEETGIVPANVKILGALSRLYINRSNYVVYPFVAFTEVRPEFTADPVEVQEIVEVNLDEKILNESISRETIHLKNGISFEVPGYRLGNHFMWGATAMIFSELLDVIRLIDK